VRFPWGLSNVRFAIEALRPPEFIITGEARRSRQRGEDGLKSVRKRKNKTAYSTDGRREEKPGDIPPATRPAILFDLDGTLLDSNYEHVLAWRLALRREGIEIPNAFLHRCIGMRGDLLLKAAYKEVGRSVSGETKKRLDSLHKKYFEKTLSSVTPMPGSVRLLRTLTRCKISWAIATGGDRNTVLRMIRSLPIPTAIPVITADDVDHAKPEPDVFLAAARQLRVRLSDCIVIGDSIWDLLGARRAKALGVGLLCGGYGETELTQAGAYRVYKDPADLLDHLAEIGIPVE
jgi:HAD superfamily hydrolase (TIGR01509 family)